jgi:hypothetical protein
MVEQEPKRDRGSWAIVAQESHMISALVLQKA